MDELDNLRNQILESKTFCFYPFLEISTRPNGMANPCCYFDEEEQIVFSEKISADNSINDFWNGKRFINIRNDIANDTPLRGCHICYRDKDASMRVRSIRENINNRKYLELVNSTIANNGIAAYSPRRLELKPNNLCNLKCIMCNAYDSSQIEKELKELDETYNGIKTRGGRFIHATPGTPGVWEGEVGEYTLPSIMDLDWASSGKFWKELEEMIPNLDVLSFAGGEPTLNPIVHKILQHCVDNDYAKNITVFISSNFTNLNKKFFEMMPYFKKFELIASIDGIEQVQEYIRYPSNWDTIKKNFEIARTYMVNPNVKILLNLTVNMLNIFYITDLLKYLDDKFLEYPYYQEWPYNINLLLHPVELRIEWIPDELRQDIIQKIIEYQTTSKILKFFPDLKVKTDLLINVLESPRDHSTANHNLNVAHNILTTLDTHRGIDYKKSIPFVENILSFRKPE
jgi:MoaA/NifB/PqqE/SkfB family radical SAM enzyme